MSGVPVEVSDLWKAFRRPGIPGLSPPPVGVLRGVGFCMKPGEFAALVGESGSGKTTLGRCLVALLRFDRGTIRIGPFDVARVGPFRRRAFARTAQMVFQNPYAALNPALRVDHILAEAVRIHQGSKRVTDELERVASLVQLPLERLRQYPSRLSGGERRRVALARALATRPGFVVADEPVSGLDAPLQVQMLELIRRIHERRKITFLLITHDLKAVRAVAARVLVLYRGVLLEDAPSARFFGPGGPLHPYSRELLSSAFDPPDPERLGTPPQAPPPEDGCPFLRRCPLAPIEPDAPCATITPPLRAVAPDHRVACHAKE